MNTPTSHVSIYGRYIGRVGALAAALGIGVMVVTAPGVATADPSSSTGDTSTSSSDAAGASSAAIDAAATEAAPTAAGTDSPGSSDSAPTAATNLPRLGDRGRDLLDYTGRAGRHRQQQWWRAD